MFVRNWWWLLLLIQGGCTALGFPKVRLTQIGYIQFLRYAIEVPPLPDFTFCLWFKADKFNYPQSVFSYSREERDRLVRVWFEPVNETTAAPEATLHAEVLGVRLLGPAGDQIGFPLKRWRHICLGWDGLSAKWQLRMDNSYVREGRNLQLLGAMIPGGGDIVVGQEYTDFDKGLEDGIEGEVTCFDVGTSAVRQKQTPNELFPGFQFEKLKHRWIESGDRIVSSASPLESSERLIESSWRRCCRDLGPGFGGNLIRWRDTPVRVFGGAIIANAHPQCGRF